MVATLSLDEILYRLLYHRPFRARFLAGEHEALGIAPAHREALAAIDTSELGAMSRRIRREVMHGSGGGGGLRRAFPRTLQWLREGWLRQRGLGQRGLGQRELGQRGLGQGALCQLDVGEGHRSVRRAVDDFIASSDFADYRDIPFGELGISLQEAFYQYAGSMEDRSERQQASLWLLHEFLVALMSLLVVHPEPGFVIRSPLVRSNGVCTFAVTRVPRWFVQQLRGCEQKKLRQGNAKQCKADRGDPEQGSSRQGNTNQGSGDKVCAYLYAAAAGRLIMGPVHDVVEELLEAGAVNEATVGPESALGEAGLSRLQFQALQQRLIRLGLLLPAAEPLRAVS